MKLKDFFKSLVFIFMPHYWLMQEPYSSSWDKKLNELLNDYEFKRVNMHTAFLGKNELWIANYPYSCFWPYRGRQAKFRASRLTILRAKIKLNKAEPFDLYKDWKRTNQVS